MAVLELQRRRPVDLSLKQVDEHELVRIIKHTKEQNYEQEKWTEISELHGFQAEES